MCQSSLRDSLRDSLRGSLGDRQRSRIQKRGQRGHLPAWQARYLIPITRSVDIEPPVVSCGRTMPAPSDLTGGCGYVALHGNGCRGSGTTCSNLRNTKTSNVHLGPVPAPRCERGLKPVPGSDGARRHWPPQFRRGTASGDTDPEVCIWSKRGLAIDLEGRTTAGTAPGGHPHTWKATSLGVY